MSKSSYTWHFAELHAETIKLGVFVLPNMCDVTDICVTEDKFLTARRPQLCFAACVSYD